jgi:TBCC domain-containing protein 1
VLTQLLDLSDKEALLVLETLISVLPGSSSSSSSANAAPVVCLGDLVLFLYIQSYKKPPIRPQKAAAASVAEVWPSTSAFDRVISTLSPLHVSLLVKIPSKMANFLHSALCPKP